MEKNSLYSDYQEHINIRIFRDVRENLEKIAIHAKTDDGFRKYDNLSHLIRCLFMKAIKEELPKLNIKQGRPSK